MPYSTSSDYFNCPCRATSSKCSDCLDYLNNRYAGRAQEIYDQMIDYDSGRE